MPIYAKTTGVGCDRTQGEIKNTLRRYGADDIVIGSSARKQSAFVQFVFEGVPVQVRVPLPDAESPEFNLTPTGRRRRNEAAAAKAWEQSCRQIWRILLLLLKAQLESVGLGIQTVDQAFMPWILLPDGQSVGDYVLPRLAEARDGAGALDALQWPGQKLLKAPPE